MIYLAIFLILVIIMFVCTIKNPEVDQEVIIISAFSFTVFLLLVASLVDSPSKKNIDTVISKKATEHILNIQSDGLKSYYVCATDDKLFYSTDTSINLDKDTCEITYDKTIDKPKIIVTDVEGYSELALIERLITIKPWDNKRLCHKTEYSIVLQNENDLVTK